jgi:5-methylcytosine-specific restriction endonuclease McrA
MVHRRSLEKLKERNKRWHRIKGEIDPKRYDPTVKNRVYSPLHLRKETPHIYIYLRNLKGKCETCGYSQHIEALEVHHIDKNGNNNELSNLIVLCCNCHNLVHNNILSILPRRIVQS